MLTHENEKACWPDRVVLLGAGGMLGGRLHAYLRERGVATLGLSSAELDLCRPEAADELSTRLEEGDALVFLAALTPDKGRGRGPFLDNLRMGDAVCEALERRPVAQLVYVSSDAVYALQHELIDERTCAGGTDLYGVMHYARETMVREAFDGPLAVIRSTMLIGPEDTHNSYGPNRFFRMAFDEGKITLFGGGEETRDFVDVEDAARLIGEVIRYRSSGLLNLARGQSFTFRELADRVAAQFPRSIEIVEAPRRVPITHRHFDNTNLFRAFPEFSFRPIEDSLSRQYRRMVAMYGD